MKSECLTFLWSKGKAIAVTFSDDGVSDHESGSDEDGNFITFIATAIVDESVVVDENPSDRELSENADLQEAYNKLCKVAAKDAMNVDLGLKKLLLLNLIRKICCWSYLILMNWLIRWRPKTCCYLIKLRIWNLNYLLFIVFDHMILILKSHAFDCKD